MFLTANHLCSSKLLFLGTVAIAQLEESSPAIPKALGLIPTLCIRLGGAAVYNLRTREMEIQGLRASLPHGKFEASLSYLIPCITFYTFFLYHFLYIRIVGYHKE